MAGKKTWNLTPEKISDILFLRGRNTGKEAAKKLGVSTATVYRVWSGKRRMKPFKTQVAAEYVRKYSDHPSRAIARVLAKERPDVFNSDEHARAFVQIVRGCRGEQIRRGMRDKSLYREPARLVG